MNFGDSSGWKIIAAMVAFRQLSVCGLILVLENSGTKEILA